MKDRVFQLLICGILACGLSTPGANTFAQGSRGIDAIVHVDEHVFEISNPRSATYRVKRSVTVLNRDGRDAGRLELVQSSLRRIRSLTGEIRDQNDRRVRRLRSRDVEEYSLFESSTLATDTRIRVAQLYHDDYPYTVDFEYEIQYSGLMHLPQWRPQGRNEMVQLSSFEVRVPRDLEIRYHAHNFDEEPVVTERGGNRIYRWEARLLASGRPEPFGPPDQSAQVKVTVTPFQWEGYRGNFTTWEDFGRFYAHLSEGRDKLPPEIVERAKALIDGIDDQRERVRVLYEFMQGSTRYVNVSLGIGGWQPFDARYVVTNGYGDCKALTNYMYALLKAMGIVSYPALIASGLDVLDVPEEFPNPFFNHVILNVPLSDAEDIWLECTSQTAPFGYIGSGNEGRRALVITPDGGRLVTTPRSTSSDNMRVQTGTIIIQPSGDASADVHRTFSGILHENVRYALVDASPRERDLWLRDQLNIPTFDIERADFSGIQKRQATIDLPVQLSLPRFASRSGTRLFVRPNLMSQWSNIPPEVPDRRQPVHFAHAFTHVDSLFFQLPAAFEAESIMDPVVIETDFAQYSASVELVAEGMLYRRRLERMATELPAERYDEYREFLRQVVQADRGQVVLVRQ